MKRVSAIFVFVAVACSDGSVPRYAQCTAADSCPSSTTCQASTPRVPTFCTAACTANKDCPDQGVCTSDVGPSATPFCYQPCPDQGCTSGQCVSVVATDTSIVKVCVPGIGTPLDGTSWTSTTLATQAKNAAITASSYSIKLAKGVYSPDAISATGAFTAMFTQTYGTSSPSVYAGCTETTTFTGGTWTTTAGTTPDTGSLKVTGAVGATDRTGCTDTAKNTAGASGVYDAVMNAGTTGAPFTVSNGVLTLGGGAGALPYSDKVDWTFTPVP